MEKIGLQAIFEDKDFNKGITSYQKSIEKAGGVTNDFSKTTSGFASGFKKQWSSLTGAIPALGALTNPITLVTAGLATFGKVASESIGAASSLNETLSKTNVIFGDAADSIISKSTQVASSLGQSQQSFLDATATFGVFGKAAGLSGDDLATFSMDLTALASDLASFSNTTPEDAIMALGAALRGESEPIRRYGVLLDDASLRQKALELGIVSTTKNALQPQQRVLAAQALIFEQTADAQGDFARTSDGLANQQRILKANVDNLKTSLGKALLPAAEAVTGALVKMTSAVIDQQNAIKESIDIQEEYKEMVEAGAIAGEDATLVITGYERAHGQAKDKVEQMRDAVERAKKRLDEEAQAAYEAALETNNLYSATSEAQRASAFFGQTLDERTNPSLEDGAVAAADYSKQLSELNSFINGKLGPEIESFTEKQGDLESQMADVQAEIDKAIKQGYSPMGEKVGELKGKLEELRGQYEENAKKHEEATRRIIFDMLQQQAALDGLTQEEFQVLSQIALDWGLIDEATKNAGDAMSLTLGQLNRGDITVAEAIATLSDINGLVQGVSGMHNIGFRISVTGDPIPSIVGGGGGGGKGLGGRELGAQSGADFIVPPGFPNDSFPMRVSSGEHVIVIPRGDSLGSVSTNNSRNVSVNMGDVIISSGMDEAAFTSRLESAILRAMA